MVFNFDVKGLTLPTTTPRNCPVRSRRRRRRRQLVSRRFNN